MDANEETERRPRVVEYITRVASLYSDVGAWALSHNWAVDEGTTIHLNEEGLGEYDVPVLKLSLGESGALAELLPQGASIIGAEGRVDLVGEFDDRIFVFLRNGGPSYSLGVVSETDGSERERVLLFEGVTVDGWYAVTDGRSRKVRTPGGRPVCANGGRGGRRAWVTSCGSLARALLEARRLWIIHTITPSTSAGLQRPPPATICPLCHTPHRSFLPVSASDYHSPPGVVELVSSMLRG